MTDSATSNLVGVWVSDPSDVTGLRVYGSVTVEFTKTGRLIYTIHGDEKDQIMLLTYSVENGVIISDQPSSPSIERTRYSFAPHGRLLLNHGDSIQTLMRSQSSGPSQNV